MATGGALKGTQKEGERAQLVTASLISLSNKRAQKVEDVAVMCQNTQIYVQDISGCYEDFTINESAQ